MKTQIWIAVSVYVLVAIVRANDSDWRAACTRFYRFSASRFSRKTPILCALQTTDAAANFAKNVNQLILFEF